jgi:hypothetical protein
MTLASLHLSYVTSIGERYPAVVDQLLRLPASEAREKVSDDLKRFVRTVLNETTGFPSTDLDSVATATEAALFELYGPPEKPAEDDEYPWEAIELDDRRTAAFYALVVDALGSKKEGRM